MSTNRRDFLQFSGSAGLMLLLAPHLISCKGGSSQTVAETIKKGISFTVPADAHYKLNKVIGNVWTFEQRGGTIGLYIDKESICVIDTQFPPQSKSLIEQIKSVSDRKIDLLINTHHHADHTSGNTAFEGLFDKHIAHTNAVINQKKEALSKETIPHLYATTQIDTEWSSKLGSENLKMKYYGAAHTNGDIVTTFENTNVAHLGDLIFNRRFPFIDKSAGANISNWVSVLDQIMADHNAETTFIFGHSDGGFPITGDQEDIKAFQNYLEKLLVFGDESIKSGKTLEELINTTKGIPGAEEWKGKGVVRSLLAVYDELS